MYEVVLLLQEKSIRKPIPFLREKRKGNEEVERCGNILKRGGRNQSTIGEIFLRGEKAVIPPSTTLLRRV